MIKVPVSSKTIVKRINRRLIDGVTLKKARTELSRAQLGEYFLVDMDHNVVTATDADIEALANRLGVLRSGEYLIHA